MPVPPLLELRLYGMLAQSRVIGADRDFAVELCSDIVEMILDLDVADRRRAALGAAHLMLEASVPGLEPSMRHALARTCERAVAIAG